MSIIYEALKKVEGKFKSSVASHESGQKNTPKKKPKPKAFIVYLFIIVLGFYSADLIIKLLAPEKKLSKQNLTSAMNINENQEIKPAEDNPRYKTTTPAGNLPAESLESASIPEKAPLSLKEQKTAQNLEPAKSDEAKRYSEPVPSFTLNGIFFSGKDGFALIDNKILSVGESLEGYVITKIDFRSVELKSKNTDSVINLRIKY